IHVLFSRELVAVKVQSPGLKQLFDTDLNNLCILAEQLALEVTEEVKATVLHPLDRTRRREFIHRFFVRLGRSASGTQHMEGGRRCSTQQTATTSTIVGSWRGLCSGRCAEWGCEGALSPRVPKPFVATPFVTPLLFSLFFTAPCYLRGFIHVIKYPYRTHIHR
ncbi:hypothetical protein VaNZ11_014874, partial [Volvox africanus]